MKFFIVCLAVALAAAEPEADPWMVYSGLSPYMTYATPYMTHYPYMMPMAARLGSFKDDNVDSTPEHALKGKYLAVSAGAIHRARRDAEPFPYNGVWGYPTSYATYPYMMPVAVRLGSFKDDNVESTPDHALKGKYLAVSAGAIHRARRDADPLITYYNNFLPSTSYYNTFPRVRSTFTTYPFIY